MARLNFDAKTGQWSSEVNVQVTIDHVCGCGEKHTVTLNWPEGLTVKGALNIANQKCTRCDAPIAFPEAQYYVENYRLLSKPMAIESPEEKLRRES